MSRPEVTSKAGPGAPSEAGPGAPPEAGPGVTSPSGRGATSKAEPPVTSGASRRVSLRHPAFWLASRVFAIALLAGQLTRLVLATLSSEALQASPAAALGIFARGLLSDGLFAALLAGPLLALAALTHGKRPQAPSRRIKRVIGLGLMSFAVLFIAVAEVLFWDEFTTRFNFIAVDYLIYTTEVVGNLRESYPMGTILGALAALALGIAFAATRLTPVRAVAPMRLRSRLATAVLAVLATTLAARAGMAMHDSAEASGALRVHAALPELARSGPFAFFAALRDNALPFERFYATVEPERLDALIGPWPKAGLAVRVAASAAAIETGAARGGPTLPGAGRRPRNVVLIEVESLSAEYLGVYGNDRGLTPRLDAIARDGVMFTQMYAIGTRTVRGLEALSAALPPLPGQSVVRRPDNAGLVTLGGVLAGHGFAPQFLYGGYGMFDNMNAWFEGSGYRVRDRSDLPPDPARFANVWGVADEHLFDEALATIDREAAGGKRMFMHLMTTSNHRPYTYPEGRIDIPSKSGRDGAVKYTDYAIGRFIDQARTRGWFDDTLFVIVADHCASVAGRTRLPPDRYHIPAIFYAPAHLAPSRVEHLASQIDLVPTLLGWLGIEHGGRFFGQDLFGEQVEQRAFLGNYQEIGMLVPSTDSGRDLVVLAPRRRISQFHVDAGGVARAAPVDEALAQRTIAHFQRADALLASGAYRLRSAALPGLRATPAVPRVATTGALVAGE